jgi:DNA-directed RNA polymerase III subunit RPC11
MLTIFPVCPSCSNALTVSTVSRNRNGTPGASDESQNRLECRTCPYEYMLESAYYDRTPMKRTEREDVIGGPGQWDNAQKAEVQCPKEGCDGLEAAYFQVQIRSADEPMTSFFKVRRIGVL